MLDELLDQLTIATEFLKPDYKMDGRKFRTTGPVSTQRAYEAIERAIEITARLKAAEADEIAHGGKIYT